MQTQTARLPLVPSAMTLPHTGSGALAVLAHRAGMLAALSAAVVAATLLCGSPARADKVPSAFGQEVLIKVALLTFNDANVTGNYSVLHAKMSGRSASSSRPSG